MVGDGEEDLLEVGLVFLELDNPDAAVDDGLQQPGDVAAGAGIAILFGLVGFVLIP